MPSNSLFPFGCTFPVSSSSIPLLCLSSSSLSLPCSSSFFRFGCACRSMNIVRMVNLFQCIIFRDHVCLSLQGNSQEFVFFTCLATVSKCICSSLVTFDGFFSML
ncbi:hypothetical protein VPH35_009167 [Triticum aestivum]